MASTELPPLTHVALTVRDLSVGVPWYEALLEAKPALDEDTDPDFHHTVYLIGNSTLLGLHQHATPAPEGDFSEFRIGLDHVDVIGRIPVRTQIGPHAGNHRKSVEVRGGRDREIFRPDGGVGQRSVVPKRNVQGAV